MARSFRLKDFAYAHRGLWAKDGLPENSLGAFRAAADAGLGIEFDLRPAADGTAIIFHDENLHRLTGQTGLSEKRSASELNALRLSGTDEPVPSFEDLLNIWPHDLPLLCEMKIDGATDPEAFARQIGAHLQDWPGLAAAMSFSEAAVRALPTGLMRGQLIAPAAEYGEDYYNGVANRALSDGIDYLSVHVTDVARTHALLEGKDTPFVTWTVRSEEMLNFVAPYGPAVIFEHFSPALALATLKP